MDLPSLFPDPIRAGHVTLRGAGPTDRRAAGRRAGPAGEPTFELFGVPFPEKLRFRTTVIQGAQGTGKTLTILKLLLPVLERMRDESNPERLILVDCKGDLTSSVLGLARHYCPGAPVHLLNPFDMFSWGIDPREFAGDPTRITRLVHALTYRRRDARTDDFFDNSARAYLILLVKILEARAPGRWGWRTFYHIATSYDLLVRVLKASKMGRVKAGGLVKKTFAGIVSTIDSWLSQYEAAFACWDRSPAFGLESFLRGRGIAVLTAPEDQRETISPIARALLREVKDRLLTDAGRDPRSRSTIVLDEFADLDQFVPIILPFFGKSRSAQVALVCAWQSWPAVCEAHGEGPMRGVLDNAAIRVWLASGQDSAEVAAKDCMAAEVRRAETSLVFAGPGEGLSGGSPKSVTVNHRVELRQNVLPGQVRSLGYAEPPDLTVRAFLTANHLPGPLYCEEGYGPFVDFLGGLPVVPAVRPRPEADLWLRPWDDVEDGNYLEELFITEK